MYSTVMHCLQGDSPPWGVKWRLSSMHGVEWRLLRVGEMETLRTHGQINQHVQSGSGNKNVVDWEWKNIIGGRSVIVACLCHQSVPVAIQWLSCHRISGAN